MGTVVQYYCPVVLPTAAQTSGGVVVPIAPAVVEPDPRHASGRRSSAKQVLDAPGALGRVDAGDLVDTRLLSELPKSLHHDAVDRAIEPRRDRLDVA